MKINVKSATDLKDQIRDFMNMAQRKIITTIADDTVKTIRSESNGQFVANKTVVSKKFIIGEVKKPEDPEGKKILDVERVTQAYKKAATNASDKAYVANLIDKA